jgi:hypothetical protein
LLEKLRMVIKTQFRLCVTTPLLEECEDETHTPEMGLGSPPRLPELQSLMEGVKKPRLGVFFISLESY